MQMGSFKAMDTMKRQYCLGHGVWPSLLMTTALVAPVTALAQAAVDPDIIPLEDIVVYQAFESPEVDGYVATQSSSATKITMPLVETPLTVNVVTEDQILDQGAESVAEALSYTSNVVTNYRGESTIYDETFIRGYTYAPKYLNGAQFGTSGFGQLDPFLLDRVEVVKGPNSVIFGSAIPGGVVNMTLKSPNENEGNSVSVAFGSDNLMQVSGDFRGTLNEAGTLKYRVAATGWSKDLQGDEFGQSRFSIAPSLSWEITPDTILDLDFIYQNDPEAGQRNFLTQVGTLDPTIGGYYYDSDLMSVAPEYDDLNRETYSLGARLNHTFDNGLIYRGSLRFTKIEQLHNGVYVDNIDTNGGDDDIADLGVVWINDSYQQFTLDNSVEAQFNTWSLGHTLLGGIDYQRQSHTSNNRSNWTTSLQYDLSNPVFITLADDPDQYLNSDNITDTDSEQTGLYLQDHIEIGGFNILLGARYDWTSTTTTYVTDGGSDTADAGALSGRIGVSYAFDNGLVPYVSYATSFQPATQYDVDDNLLDSSDARQFEVGAKWASADNRIFLSAAYFDIEQTNIAEIDPDNGWPNYANIGTRRAKGLELEAKAEINDRLSVIASLGTVDAQMTSGEYKGFTAQRIPKRSAALWLKYEMFDGITTSVGARYTGSSYGDYAEDTVVPSYTLFDLGLSADLGRFNPRLSGLTASAAITNVADKTYVASCIASADDYCWYGEGREYKVSLTYAF